jgi:hypothetical protein
MVLGCQTIRQKILGEKDTLTPGEITGIYNQQNGYPVFQKVARHETQIARLKKWLQKAVEQNVKIYNALVNSEQIEQTPESQPPPDNFTYEYTYTNYRQYTHRVYLYQHSREISISKTSYRLVSDEYGIMPQRTLFLEPGEEDQRATIVIYLPRRVPSRWKVILSPDVDISGKDPTQGLFEYVMDTIIKNIENIQGKAGIALEW